MGLRLGCLRRIRIGRGDGRKAETGEEEDAGNASPTGAGRNNSYTEDPTRLPTARSTTVSPQTVQRLIDEGRTVNIIILYYAERQHKNHNSKD